MEADPITQPITLAGAALDLVFGARCAGCERPGPAICPACTISTVPHPAVRWPDPVPPWLAVPWSAGPYVDPLRRLLVAYKDHDRASLVRPLGSALAAAVEGAVTGSSTARPAAVDLVPVPSAAASVRRRGRDVVADLARCAARRLRRRGWQVRTIPGLTMSRAVADQASLSAVERAANLHQALAVRPGLVLRRPVIVVDDVLTTGATAAEAVRALRDVGGSVHAVAVVAATPRWIRDQPDGRWPQPVQQG